MCSHANLVCVLVLSACQLPTAQEVSPPPGASEAISYAWAAYSHTDTPPEVVWLEGQCHDGLGFLDPQRGGCVWGMFFPSLNRAYVTAHPNARAIALAHEFLHATLGREGNVDPDHRSARWGVDNLHVAEELFYDLGF